MVRTRTRPVALLLGLALALVMLFAAARPASASLRLDDIPMPSTQGNVDPQKVVLNKVTELRAAVLLPDGYDADPSKQWPVLYLMQGIGDNYLGWVNSGQIQSLAANFQGIVVMPEGGRGFFANWWQNGARNGPDWMDYELDEVVPTIESKYRIAPGRANHSIGGLSMGGYGALELAGALPSYFGSVISLSGLLDNQAGETQLLLPQSVPAAYSGLWGPATGQYASWLDPTKGVSNTAHTRLFVSTGNGLPDFTVPVNSIDPWTVGAVAEASSLLQANIFVANARAAGSPVSFHSTGGVHDWPYWRRELPVALAWGPFKSTGLDDVSKATSWTYRTMANHGNAWDLGFQMAGPTTVINTFTRSGQTLSGKGAGTVTITPGAADDDSSGNGSATQCAFTATLPFTHTLPAGC